MRSVALKNDKKAKLMLFITGVVLILCFSSDCADILNNHNGMYVYTCRQLIIKLTKGNSFSVYSLLSVYGLRIAYTLKDKVYIAISKSYCLKNQGLNMSILDKVKDIGSDLLKKVENSTEAKSTTANKYERTYTVQSGDTLSSIAKHFYSDASLYMKIFEANKSTLTSPDKIMPGQVLYIPE